MDQHNDNDLIQHLLIVFQLSSKLYFLEYNPA